jgi:hypothetical protein
MESRQGRQAETAEILQELSICALPHSEVGEPEMLLEVGVLRASVSTPPVALEEYLAQHGPASVARMEQAKLHERDLRDLGRRVEHQLRLRQLLRDPELSAANFQLGCWHLLEHKSYLHRYIEGSTLRLSDRNEIIAGQHVIDIAYNFEL